jgi:hypothetical protein
MAADTGDRRFVAHVSSHRTTQEALLAYQKLKYLLPSEYATVKPFIQEVDLGSKGKWHRLRLGPLMTQEEAVALCGVVKSARHSFCEVKDAFDLAQKAAGYYGELLLKPLNDGQNMRVMKPFGFVDSEARVWEVPIGAVTDGASIPRAFWTIVGSPFTGKYLQAAVIHDHFVQTKRRTWSLTHDAFYEAMIANGVEKKLALLMWAAVYRFGPRWAENESYCAETCAGGNIVLESVEIFPQYVEREFKRITQMIEHDPGVSKAAVLDFIEKETYWPPGSSADSLSPPYPARVKGYVSSSFNDGDGDPKFVPSDWAEGPGNRRFVDGLATTRWPFYGSDPHGAICHNCNIRYRVSRVGPDDTLNVRTGPGARYDVIGRLRHDAEGIVIQRPCNSMWCRIKYGSLEGYVDTSFLEFAGTDRN